MHTARGRRSTAPPQTARGIERSHGVRFRAIIPTSNLFILRSSARDYSVFVYVLFVYVGVCMTVCCLLCCVVLTAWQRDRDRDRTGTAAAKGRIELTQK